jgi:hypothetical protein
MHTRIPVIVDIEVADATEARHARVKLEEQLRNPMVGIMLRAAGIVVRDVRVGDPETTAE